MPRALAGAIPLAIALILPSAACWHDVDKLRWAPVCPVDSGGQVGDSCEPEHLDKDTSRWLCSDCSRAAVVNNHCIGASDTSTGTCFDLEWARWPVPPSSPPDDQYEWTAEIVKDHATGLVWERKVSSDTDASYAWTDAKRRCEELDLGGFSSGWRLPSMMELLTLVDYTKFGPAINSSAFPGTPFAADLRTTKDYYWTSSPFANAEDGKAWSVSFRGGGFIQNDVELPFFVRCVRTDAAH